MEKAPTLCINCGTSSNTVYCPNCGQKNPTRKITFGNMWYDFQSRIYGFDGMFPRTFKDLTLRPGVVTKEFIKGNRVKYYGPVGYFFLMVTVFLLLLSLLNISFYDFAIATSPTSESIKPHSGMEKFMKMLSDWMAENMKIFSFLIIPFNAFTSRWFFRKSGLNWLEHTVLVFYTHGHIYWMTFLSLFIFKLSGVNLFSMLQTVVFTILFSLGCTQLFDYQSKVKAFFKGVAASLLSSLLFIVFFMLSGGIYIYFHPELLELIRPSNNQ